MTPRSSTIDRFPVYFHGGGSQWGSRKSDLKNAWKVPAPTWSVRSRQKSAFFAPMIRSDLRLWSGHFCAYDPVVIAPMIRWEIDKKWRQEHGLG